MSVQHWIWAADGAALGIALVAGVADWRRTNRSTIDGWGWMPWRGVQVLALFAALGLTLLAVQR